MYNHAVAVCAGGSAMFTCTVMFMTKQNTSVGWLILIMDGGYAYVFNRDCHMLTGNNGAILIENLTISNITIADNGTLYRCNPIPTLSSSTILYFSL